MNTTAALEHNLGGLGRISLRYLLVLLEAPGDTLQVNNVFKPLFCMIELGVDMRK